MPVAHPINRTVLLGKVDRIPPIGLDMRAQLSRDQRWRDDSALVSRSGKLSLNAITAWPGISRVRIAFAAACPEAELFRYIAYSLQPAAP
jgi:hypothetical protein